jgi:hypothetical protein
VIHGEWARLTNAPDSNLKGINPMKSYKSLVGLLGLAAALAAGPASAQNLSPEPPAPVAPARATQSAPEAVSSRQGTFKFVITLVRRSNSMIPANVVPICMASVYHWPATYNNVQGGVQSSASKCTITLPYYWPGADTSYDISPRVWLMINKENFPLPGPVIYSVRDLGMQDLPANGTTVTFNATLHY